MALSTSQRITQSFANTVQLSNIGDMSALGMENWKLVRMYLIMMKGRGERRRLKVVWWMSRSSKVCITTEAAIRVNIAKSN